jgi:Fic family protein
MYIYEDKKWPDFKWSQKQISTLLAKVKLEQGLLLGKMQNMGFYIKDSALLQTVTEEILKSNQIEGEILDIRQVRSSIARKFGLESAEKVKASRNIDGFVDMMYDAIHNFNAPITKKRLCLWHAQMFPEKKSGLYKIETGKYRDDKLGPMQVVSGPMGMEKVHYQAPDAKVLNDEMAKLIRFINEDTKNDDIIKAAITHLWFVILHPFDDGNGRIARALTEMLLARSENSSHRFYSMSSQIEKNRKSYYEALQITQGGSLNITSWLEWFLETLLGAIENSQNLLKTILIKSDFWNAHQGESFSNRQSKMLNMLLDGFKGNLTSTKWAKLCKCSHDTAGRDITDLITRKILKKIGDGRNTHYVLVQEKNGSAIN